MIHLEPCKRRIWSPIWVPDAHGDHQDRLFTYIRRLPGSTILRLFIVLQHTPVSAAFDPPVIPQEGGGLLQF